uniref:RGWamide receptor 1 n=1 Tax=Platynereis dumerilii TaxID=6359 RepID=A0A0K0PUW0_PLADU|nr:RGWamide receptor 1 [Platynereis dumerilii]
METNLSFFNESTENGTEDYEEFYHKAQFYTGLICYPIVCLFGLTGNILSIVVLNHRKMTSSTNVYLICLAVSDSIKLINDSSYFLVTLLLNTNPPMGQKAYAYLYPYAHYLLNMSVCVTAWLTVSVAAERYIMVCHATRARGLCSMARARFTSAMVFLTMSLLTVPFALRYKTVYKQDPILNATIVDVDVAKLWQDPVFVTTYTWIANLLRSIIPLLILCTFNYFIIQALRRTRSTKRKMSSRHRITLMLMSVIIVFMICVTPDAIISTVFGFGYADANFLIRGVREITDLLLTINSGVNFVLYCTFNKIFRRNFVALFCKQCSDGTKEEQFAGRSSFASFKGTVMNGSERKEPLCQHEWVQSAI